MSDERGRRFRDTLELEPEFVTALLDTVAALVIVLDAQGHILRFNRACEFATDYRQEEVRSWSGSCSSTRCRPSRSRSPWR